MKHIEGLSRDQMILFPEALDEYISQDNPVRFINAFIDTLDLHQMGFTHTILQETGRPPYHPGDLLKLYLYGYLNRIRSSRQLERESHRNVEVMWLIQRLAPDFKTIADFRRYNREPVRQVCREFTLFCTNLELFSGELVAIDGSKFKAVNSRRKNFTKKRLKRTIQKLDEDIDRYLDEMDEADEEEPEEKKLSDEELQEKIEEMRRLRAEAEKMKKELDESGETQISLTDPDSRMMPVSGDRRTDVSYNVQVSVDEKHKLIVDHEVTNAVAQYIQRWVKPNNPSLFADAALDLTHSKTELILENAFLPQQLIVLNRQVKRPALKPHKRVLIEWCWPAGCGPGNRL